MLNHTKFFFISWILIFLLQACNSGVKDQDSNIYIQKPIVFDSNRKELSLEYLKDRYGIIQDEPYIVPRMIVLHWTAIPTMQETFEAFDPPILPSSRAGIQSASSLNVSAHYLVDRDGTIYQLLADTIFARHVIGLNHCAVGIENVGGEEMPLTDAQRESNVFLIEQLAGKYPIEYLIGHYEYTEFIGHELWLEKDPDYLTEKTDPGEEFMAKVRDRVVDLGLMGTP